MFPDAPDISAFYMPDPPGVRELNMGDEWRAVWVAEGEPPADAPVTRAYAVVIFEGRGYVTRASGEANWDTVESSLAAGENVKAWQKRALAEQLGATVGTTELMGYFILRATSHNATYPVGAATVRPVYLIVPKRLKDLGPQSQWERRRLPLNEFAGALRTRYPEMHQQLTKAVDRYLVLKSTGTVA